MTHIPQDVRVALYWIGYVTGVLASGITVVTAAVAAASPDFAMPLWLVVTASVLTFLTTQLHMVARGNMPSLEDAVGG